MRKPLQANEVCIPFVLLFTLTQYFGENELLYYYLCFLDFQNVNMISSDIITGGKGLVKPETDGEVKKLPGGKTKAKVNSKQIVVSHLISRKSQQSTSKEPPEIRRSL
jgi:hypothetical protein